MEAQPLADLEKRLRGVLQKAFGLADLLTLDIVCDRLALVFVEHGAEIVTAHAGICGEIGNGRSEEHTSELQSR